MKVLLVNHFPLQGSGSGIYTMNIAKELLNEGHKVFVIDIDNHMEVNDNYGFLRETIICDAEKNQFPDLNFNFPCFTTHPRSTMTYYDLTPAQIRTYVSIYCEKVQAVVQDFQPDIIHAQHIWVAPFAAATTRLPFIITAHGTDLMGFKKDARYHPYAMEGINRAFKVITISKQVHEDVKELYGVGEDKLFLNPNGFDDSIFHFRQTDKKAMMKKFGIPDKFTKIVSFVGKFTDFKGIDVLINAADVVKMKHPEVAFALAGDGGLRSDMEELVRELKLDNIFFLGHQNQNTIADLYSIAELSVVPSRVEPFGLVAIEAMACGTPVVATNAGGLPDFVHDKVGRLVEMNDMLGLAYAIVDELEAGTKITKGRVAALSAIENYSWRKTLQNVVKLYENALK